MPDDDADDDDSDEDDDGEMPWEPAAFLPPTISQPDPAQPGKSIVVLPVGGEIDLDEAPELGTRIKRCMEDNVSVLLLDLSKASYIDSSGLALFIDAMQRIQASGGKFGLCSVEGSVKKIFEISRLDQVMHVYENPQQAADALGVPSGVPPQARESLDVKLGQINAEVMRYFSKHPDKLREVDPFRFEELIAEIFRDMGCDVVVTPRSGDGGRDILASFKTPWGNYMVYVEAKRYAEHRKIGPDIVRSFMYVVNDNKASCGVIATTSSFTKGAREIEAKERNKLSLRDMNDVCGWMSDYGKWKRDGNVGLWVPK